MPLPFGASLSGDVTEDQLVEDCKRGDFRAFERLYEQHAPRMKSIAFHLLNNRGDAEDAVQEAFLKVYRGLNRFAGQSSLGTWIYRILINCCYDVGRKRQRRAETGQPPDLATTSSVPLRLALERALGKISDQRRMVFLLHEVEGLKHSEIGAILDVPEGTSKGWLFEAKVQFKRLLMESRA